MSDVLLVTNKASGGSDDDVIDRVRETLSTLGPVEVCRPSSLERFGDEVVEASRGARHVVVAGGDGTFNCTVNALDGRLDQHVLGLVPMGTGNDLARTLGIPFDPVEAAGIVPEGPELVVDVGRASGPGVERLFVNACMGGFPVEVNEAIDGDIKKRFGPLAFWIGGLKAATNFEKSTVRVNGREFPDCVAAGVGNGRTCGGGLEVWPRAAPDDGAFDGCVLAADSYPAALQLAARVRAGSHEELDEVQTWTESRFEIEAEPNIEFNVDGELIDLKTPATFELVDHLTITVPG